MIIIKSLHLLDKYFEEVVCAIGLSLIATCVFLQFVTRFFFGSAMAWPEEVSAYAMAWSMYIGACMCVREKGHMRVLLGVKRLPRRLGIPVIMFADLLWFGFCVFMVFIGADYISLLIDQPMISPALGVDQRWPQSIIPFGFGLMAFRIIQHYILWFKGGCSDLPA